MVRANLARINVQCWYDIHARTAVQLEGDELVLSDNHSVSDILIHLAVYSVQPFGVVAVSLWPVTDYRISPIINCTRL